MKLDAFALTLCIGCQFFLVGGQLLLKKAMNPTRAPAASHDWRPIRFVLGIAALSIWFFVWIGILQQHELSRVFVFEGLNPAFLSLAAWLFLKERLGVATWAGIFLICAGITLSALS